MENTLISAMIMNFGFDPAEPEVLLELTLKLPVDWEAKDERGGTICADLRFRLIVDHGLQPLEIECRYARLDRDLRVKVPTYRIVLTPVTAEKGEDRFLHEDMLKTVVQEARFCGRDWTGDIHRIEVFWKHRRDQVAVIGHDGYVEPKAAAAKLPEASGKDTPLETLFAQFDDALDLVEKGPEGFYADFALEFDRAQITNA